WKEKNTSFKTGTSCCSVLTYNQKLDVNVKQPEKGSFSGCFYCLCFAGSNKYNLGNSGSSFTSQSSGSFFSSLCMAKSPAAPPMRKAARPSQMPLLVTNPIN